MASGHVNRINRPNTWLHRPSLLREDSSCQLGAVHTWHLADIERCPSHVRFSNRPFWVKRFQTIRRCSVEVSHGLALLFGLGTKALPSWGSKTRWNNLSGDLAVGLTAGPSGHANSPHPSSREGHHSTPGGARVFSCQVRSCAVLMPPQPLGSSGTRCRQPRCGA
jgi:hypothetical protein